MRLEELPLRIAALAALLLWEMSLGKAAALETYKCLPRKSIRVSTRPSRAVCIHRDGQWRRASSRPCRVNLFQQVSLPDPVDSDGRSRVVVDLARALSPAEYEHLRTRIHQIEDTSGYRIRILTQRFETVGRAIGRYFGLDDQRTVLVVLDERSGNVLNFRVGEAVTERFPASFWLELQGRYGNQFFVREHGEYRVLDACISALETCLQSDRICRFVPGFGRDQWALSFFMSLLGGAVIGFTARTPQDRREAKTPNWRWILVFSPLWAIFLVSFGTLPIVAREGWLNRDLAANWAGAALVATAFWYAIPRVFPGGTR
ncbi:hypothetical protein F1559_004148 [Cyanidiococcus yangmingshanensis]|uniref:TPM domain-containing protein n=1 Tax=Cyanidiococcus yangmingshanensis TaxID=2690220 RepID=A0A7J7IL23_9RHOD|nr:hypothetical protein F1559_004148 [Cyanidiococcus yangmingshanensis]